MRVVSVSNHVVSLPFTGLFSLQGAPTNTYMVMDHGQALIVDVGTSDAGSLDALSDTMDALDVQRVVGVLATHYHVDHTEGLSAVTRLWDVPVYLHTDDWPAYHADQKRPDTGPHLTETPDVLMVGELSLSVAHTPGHTRGHVHVLIPDDRVVLVGDHLAGNGSVWIGPPDGNMADYYHALDQLIALDGWQAAPGHGRVLKDAAEAASMAKEHRLLREHQILSLVQAKPSTVEQLLNTIYDKRIPNAVRFAAERTIMGHLEHLEALGCVTHDASESPLLWHRT